MTNFYRFLIALLLLLVQSTTLAKEVKLSSGAKQVNLIELFSSEGCSSCPPAESWLNGLQEDPRLWKQIVPLVFHVDYWDYLDWKDSFATPSNTQRQARYKRQRGIKTVYTPGFIVNGKEWRRWFSSREIPISNLNVGMLDVTINDQEISATFSPENATQSSLRLNVALLGFGFETKVRSGENSGRTLEHDFVVIGQNSKDSPDGTWEMTIPSTQHTSAKKLGIAIWVTQPYLQKPIQAVGGWLN